MIKYVLTYLLLQVGFAVSSQQAYFKEFDNSYSEVFYDVAETNNGFIICGTTELANAEPINDNDAYLVKIDEQGSVVWSKILNEDYHERFERIHYAHDSYYIVGTTHSKNSNGNRKFWKYSQNGELLLSVDFGDSVLAWYDNRIFEFLDVGDGFIVAGSGSADTATITDGELIKLDYSGNVLWSQRYTYDVGSTTADMVKGIKQEDNGFIMLLHSYTSDTPNHSEHIIKTDLLGNELWRKNVTNYSIPNEFALAGMTNRPTAIAPYQNGYVMVAQAQDEFERTFRTYLIQLDGDGNEVEVTAFLDSIDHTVFNIYTNTQDEIFVLGLDMTEYSVTDWAWQHQVIKWDGTDNLMWKKRNGADNIINWHSNGIQTKDGSFISVGHIFRAPTPRRNPIIVKTDCQGNIEWDYTPCSINDDNTPLIFPNPSSGIYHIQFNEEIDVSIYVYDLNGRIVNEMSEVNSSVLNLDLSSLSRGVYSYRMVLDGEIVFGKLIKQ